MSIEAPASVHGLAADGWPFWPAFDDAEREALERVLSSRRWWRNEGDETARFEAEFSAYQGGGHALALANGTQAIEIALAAFGIGEGDEVIVPSLTFYSTASAVIRVGASAVLVDVLSDTYCINIERVAEAITPRTRAVVAVHMGGQMCDVVALSELCRRHGLIFIEDAAHAPGAEWAGLRAGQASDAAIFSFQAAKLLTAGEGGLALFRDPQVHCAALQISNCGRLPGDTTYDHRYAGTNARISEFQACLLRAQLARLDAQVERRGGAYAYVATALLGTPGASFQRTALQANRHVHYAMMLELSAERLAGRSRDEVVAMLRSLGTPAGVSYPPLQRLPIFAALGDRVRISETPVADRVAAALITLPHRLLLAPADRLEALVGSLRAALSD